MKQTFLARRASWSGWLARPKPQPPARPARRAGSAWAWVDVPPPAFGDNVIGLRGLIIHDLKPEKRGAAGGT